MLLLLLNAADICCCSVAAICCCSEVEGDADTLVLCYFHPSSVSGNGSIVGIVAGVVFAVFLMLDLKGLELPTGSFTVRQIKAATKNFDFANKIEESGFGLVYEGLLLDGTVIAVKQLSSKSKQGNCEFVNEIGMISALQHPNLVKLYGCCIEGKQLLLVYEYMENNSLARALFGPEEHQLTLDRPTKHQIYIGIAKGLTYLHESTLKIFHRDIKAVNVLLDKNLNPKTSDFGLAKLDDEEENAHISTRRIMGTRGYMAPKYAMWGYLTNKADVYSFKVVALEIVCGRRATSSYRRNEDSFNLLELGLDLKEKGNLMELVDQRLESDCNKEQVMVMLNVVLLCTNATAAIRPTIIKPPNTDTNKNTGFKLRILKKWKKETTAIVKCTKYGFALADRFNGNTKTMPTWELQRSKHTSSLATTTDRKRSNSVNRWLDE
ncbi:hypothetical protein TEA_025032 [Camellia sinensis var. sinensis]|uniref:Protein kinase domain-containing protein n=1 Tax=Camellia sinensis var. sinensis TaxID=542762 RepID=A0A4S4E7X6_CAMSN|nr:hypothetical protein TEA_025032 [Camellia sinensis var. sinensis]